MKVLLVHDHYRSAAPSGEDQVFRNEVQLLASRGIEVRTFERFNDEIDDSTLINRIHLARETAWSNRIYLELTETLRRTTPDIVHFHNTFPLISPSAYLACQRLRIPVVQTLHNFRLICPGGLLLRNGAPCEDCVGASLLPALRHRCYRDSLPATGAVVWMLQRNRWNGSYETLVDRYVALTHFAADRLIRGGIPKDRIRIKPNFLPDAIVPGQGDGGYVVYVGRLSEEKGVQTLLNAWRQLPEIPLKILGEGPLRPSLQETAARHRLPVEFLGYCDRTTIMREIGRAAFQIVPSEWYEGFPMVVVEAYASGTPIVASRIGSLDEIIEDHVTGMKFTPGDSQNLAATVKTLWHNPHARMALRRGARQAFEQRYSAPANFTTLMDIYHSATTTAHAQFLAA
jgi:glycosyltransferase involved in cell wall biosynthesis